jgi:L-ascorbate metabolism protein UlaG (beta-lactamase superfamily)
MRYNDLEISKISHDCFQIIGSKIIYTDPYKIEQRIQPADIILVTHEHFDHFSPDDIRKISRQNTSLVAAEFVSSQMPADLTFKTSQFLAVGNSVDIDGVKIEAVLAYNTNKFKAPGQPFHPKGEGRVGFVFELDGNRLYLAGDTDFIPEMGDLQNIDVAFLPVSGTYVMSAKEAVEAARTINPKVAIPMHYGAIVGSRDDAEYFRQNAPCKVEIL